MVCYYCGLRGTRLLFSLQLNDWVHLACVREAILEGDEEAEKLKPLFELDQRGMPLNIERDR